MELRSLDRIGKTSPLIGKPIIIIANTKVCIFSELSDAIIRYDV